MIPSLDEWTQAASDHPTNKWHDGLKRSEEERNEEDILYSNARRGDASSGGNRGRIHGETDRKNENGAEVHHNIIAPVS